MSMQKKQPISKKPSQSKDRQAGVKMQTSVKAGYGGDGSIGTRVGPVYHRPHH